MAEFARSDGHNYHDGHCNPWNAAHVTGGSSSGSGSSVGRAQARGARLRHRRLPAAICGITGLKVTPGG
jgi:aspartyl-tRNA(Asn)/glutamyl-tRNA(Gln) amidotransferase subunit A